MTTATATKAAPATRGTSRRAAARTRTEAEKRHGVRLARIPIARCRIHPGNERDLGDLRDLAWSIGTTGMEQPVTAQKNPGGWFEIVDGARRFAAEKLNGATTIEAFVRAPRAHDEVVAATLATDIHKKHMTAIERGDKIDQLREHDWTTEEIAAYLGVAVSTVYGYTHQAKLARAELEAEAARARGEHVDVDLPRQRQARPPKWRTQVADVRARWEDQLGPDGLNRDQAMALLAELAELAGEQESR